MTAPDRVSQAIAAVEESSPARPYTVAIGLDGPPGARQAVVTLPLDATDAEILWVAGQFAINGRQAILAQRQRDKSRGLVVAHAMPGLRQ